MKLSAKEPELEVNRFKALIYGSTGAGKTHFCCSIPNVYFIDTEGVLKYKKFVKLLKENNSVSVVKNELNEIIDEVKALMTVKHNYKTLIIDSLSFPYSMLSNMEAERLISQSRKQGVEGTEFGANLAKPKRLTFHLGILLARLDMNVIVTAHEKSKFENNQEVGKTYDINDKMAYALGTVMNLRMIGNKSRVAFFEKSRYSELPNRETIPFEDGYQVLKDLFGEETFSREVKVEKLISQESLEELKNLMMILNVSKETEQKFILSSKAATLEDVSEERALTYINFLKSKLPGEEKDV